MEMCRACLSTGTNMTRMDETLVDDFNVLTNLNVELTEEMPFFTCKECLLGIKFCMQFRKKCIASYSAFEGLLNEDKEINQELVEFNDDSADNKYEIKIEDDSNDAWRMEEIEEKGETKEDNVNDITEWMEFNQVHCGLCPEMFNSKQALMDHLAIHKADNICLLCQHQASSIAQLLAHRTKHVPIEQSECLFCIKVFMSTASLAFHYMTTHKRDIYNEWTEEETQEDILYITDVPETGIDEEKIRSNGRKKPKVIIPKHIVLNESEIKQLLRQPMKGVSPYFCGLCPLEFDDKSAAVQHFNTAHSFDSACLICDRKSQSYPNLLAHRMNHVPANQNGCVFCDKFFKSPASLEFHYLSIHKLGEKHNLPFVCQLCFRGYDTYLKLKAHMKVRHSSRRFICDYCSKSFKSRVSMTTHLATHAEVKIFKCDVCDFSCKISGNLKDHKLRCHTESRVYCNMCRRAFPNQLQLDKHRPCKVRHRRCPLCGINLKPTSSLTRHMRCHTENALFECDRCPAKYRSRTVLNNHLNRHNNDRKYRCEFCPMSFFAQPVLIKHRRIHTGEKPYVCKLCDKAFTGNNNLKVHMKVHGLDLVNKREKPVKTS